MNRRRVRVAAVTGAALVAFLTVTSSAFAHAALSPPVAETGVLQQFTLAGSKAKVGADSLTFSFRTGTFMYKTSKNVLLPAVLMQYGAVNDTVFMPISVPVRLKMDSAHYGGNVDFDYTGRRNVFGQGK